MNWLRIALAAAAAALPVLAVAQQMDHSTHMPAMGAQEPAPQRKPAPAAQADPHGGHDMGGMGRASSPARSSRGAGAKPVAASSAAPHAGHDMGAMGRGSSAARPPRAGAKPAASSSADPHGGHPRGAIGGMGAMGGAQRERPNPPPPPAALSGPAHAADLVFSPSAMARAREHIRAEMGDLRAYRVLIDQIETQFRKGRKGYLWEAQGWYGGDINKLWIKTEGGGTFGDRLETGDVQALWSRAIAPFWDFQAGVRYDFARRAKRSHAVVGVQGLAPYWFEIDTAAFLSEKGDLTGRFEAAYDFLITQRLILQPRVELELSAQDIPELGIGAGLSSIEAGLRLRYEFVPEFAPYIGVNWERKLGKTASFARREGEEQSSATLVTGLRVWF